MPGSSPVARIAIHLLVFCGVAWTSFATRAAPVEVFPESNHQALTMTTDSTYGFMVLPGSPLDLDLTGPGKLKLTIRLNQYRKRDTYRGKLEIRRDNRLVKRSSLRLMASRVGAYLEDNKLRPSMAKVIRLIVPAGKQTYQLKLSAAKGVNMTVRIQYYSEAKQAAARDTDPLGLVALVPKEDDKPTLAPQTTESAATAKQPEKTPSVGASMKAANAFGLRPKTVTQKPVEPIAPQPTHESKPPKTVAARKPTPGPVIHRQPPTEVISAPKDDVTTGVSTKPKKRSPGWLSIGVKGGQLSTIPMVSGTSPIGSLDIRMNLPVLDGRLAIGVEAGFLPLNLDMTNYDASVKAMVIPLALQMYYNIPLTGSFDLFTGLGLDVFVFASEESQLNQQPEYKVSGSNAAMGGHLSLGFELLLGPGKLFVEGRATEFITGTDIYQMAGTLALSSVAGYRFIL